MAPQSLSVYSIVTKIGGTLSGYVQHFDKDSENFSEVSVLQQLQHLSKALTGMSFHLV